MTKNSPARATNAHVSIVGHVTAAELRKYLTTTECGNGFANRFLWLCVKRSKCLPEGGQISQVNFAPILHRLRLAVDFGRKAGRVQFDDRARNSWREVYEVLSTGHSGLYGAVTGRAEAHTIRFALIYALLDCSPAIRLEHLEAALALVEYADDSAKYIFGDSTGDADADTILLALKQRPDGMTRTEISALFGRHRGADQISRALNFLKDQKRIAMSVIKTTGRDAELWAYIGMVSEAMPRREMSVHEFL
jgi:hypothetical protein